MLESDERYCKDETMFSHMLKTVLQFGGQTATPDTYFKYNHLYCARKRDLLSMKYYETSVATDVCFKNKSNFSSTEPQKLNFMNQIRLYCKNTSKDICLQV